MDCCAVCTGHGTYPGEGAQCFVHGVLFLRAGLGACAEVELGWYLGTLRKEPFGDDSCPKHQEALFSCDVMCSYSADVV